MGLESTPLDQLGQNGTTKTGVRQVSILGPFAYETNALPLRHDACEPFYAVFRAWFLRPGVEPGTQVSKTRVLTTTLSETFRARELNPSLQGENLVS